MRSGKASRTEKNNRTPLTWVTWAAAILGLLLLLWLRQKTGTAASPRLTGEDALLLLLLPLAGVGLGLVACFGRTRSGVRRPLSMLNALPVAISGVMITAVLVLWLSGPS